jgi:hypothetical protein
MFRTRGPWIVDDEGRRIIFRGANVSGSSKVPFRGSDAGGAGDDLSAAERLYDWRGASFVGRPFPLDEARARFRNMSAWGLRFLRLLVAWEGVEHEGPGEYDADYLSYLRAIAEEAAGAGIDLYIDPHQDVWSRWTGGDGAPAWTLIDLGFDVRALHASGAAVVYEETDDAKGTMIWPSNHNRLACATMFTLFFAGNEFAPGIRVRGEPVQEYLQGSYIRAMTEVAKALEGLPNVVGFGPMNEPALGFIGHRDASRLERATMRRGLMPSPLEAMAAGEGLRASAERWAIDALGNHRAGRGEINPKGVRAWRDGETCVWRRAGVWDMEGGKARLLRPGHFRSEGRATDRYLKPFYRRFIESIRGVLPDSLAFVEGVPNDEHPTWKADDPPLTVHAAHWYDDLTLVTKRYHRSLYVDSRTMRISLGARTVAKAYESCIGRWKVASETDMGGMPTLIGEFGLPFDMDGRKAYGAVARGEAPEKAFSRHEKALAGYYRALDALLLSATIWNYTTDNDPEEGDRWNGEDLSVYCEALGGPRALRGFSRPYAMRTAGEPLRMSFDPRAARFEFEWEIDGAVSAPTEIFLPACWYPGPLSVRTGPEGIEWNWDEGGRILSLRCGAGGRAHVAIEPGKA